MAEMISGVFLGLAIPITLSLELKRVCDIYPGHFARGDTHMALFWSRHKKHTSLASSLPILFVAVCLSGCSNKDSLESLEIDVMAWNEKLDKLKAKIKKAAADNDSVAHRNNEEEAKRLEVELGELLERTNALEAEKEGRI
jgi:outer membrane murein-binding lipoprotein Lpp